MVKINPAMCFYCLEVEKRTVGCTDSWRSRHFIFKCPKLPEATAHRRPMSDKEKASIAEITNQTMGKGKSDFTPKGNYLHILRSTSRMTVSHICRPGPSGSPSKAKPVLRK